MENKGNRMTSSGPVVRVAGIQKTYDRAHYAVDNIEFEIEQGSFLTLLGPSGSGKTTCLHLIAGFEHPDAGKIWLQGRDMDRVPPYQRDLGVVFQNYALFPNKTVYENVAYPLRVRRWSSTQIKGAVERVLSLVQLNAFGSRYPQQLSGGQQQRVAIARAIVFEPAMVLMDEPLGALDRKLREQLQREIRWLHKETGLTVLYVTHDQEEALVMSDRVGVMNNGRLEQIGPPAQIYREPATRFVASFIGESNLINGVIAGTEQGETIIKVGEDIVLRGQSKRPLRPGDAAVLVIRPEFIEICEEEPRYGPQNRLTCHIDDVVFTGEQMRVALAHPILGRIFVKRSTTYFETKLRPDAKNTAISFPAAKAIIL
jgi:putative spermidine/putrescine transport system ATP-binding protein